MAKVIPLDTPAKNELPNFNNLFSGYNGSILSDAVKLMLPRYIKIEAKYLPDFLIDTSAGAKNPVIKKLKEITQPKVYFLLYSGDAFMLDLNTGKVKKINPDPRIFQKGSLQKLFTTETGLAILGFVLGATGFYLFKKLKG